MTQDKATVTVIDNQTKKQFDLPVLSGSVGPQVVDVRKFYGDTGYFTYDPGYTSTGPANPRSPISTAMRASSCTAATRSRTSPTIATSWKSPI